MHRVCCVGRCPLCFDRPKHHTSTGPNTAFQQAPTLPQHLFDLLLLKFSAPGELALLICAPDLSLRVTAAYPHQPTQLNSTVQGSAAGIRCTMSLHDTSTSYVAALALDAGCPTKHMACPLARFGCLTARPGITTPHLPKLDVQHRNGHPVCRGGCLCTLPAALNPRYTMVWVSVACFEA